MSLPLYLNPIIGYRRWRVRVIRGKLTLLSILHTYDWPMQKPLIAECKCSHINYVHLGPDINTLTSDCGIYAYKSYELMSEDIPQHDGIFGRVALWGRVVEAEKGYKATKAYPLQIDGGFCILCLKQLTFNMEIIWNTVADTTHPAIASGPVHKKCYNSLYLQNPIDYGYFSDFLKIINQNYNLEQEMK